MTASIAILDLYSFSDLRRAGALAAIGDAFDAEPRLRPERMDLRDPIRNKVTSAREYFRSVESTSPRPAYVYFQRRSVPEFVGSLDSADEAAAPADVPRRLWLSTGDLSWLEDAAHADAFGELAVRLAGAFDAAYGFVTHSKMPWQQRIEFIKVAAGGGPRMVEPSLYTDRHSLRDVYWINILGPAFVERFGSRLNGLGIRQAPTANGGVAIWATDTPFTYDETLQSHRDYPWKQPFYDALGPDAFVHVDQLSTGNVPTRGDHRRLAQRG